MIKPKSAEIYLIYQCPKCQCEWHQTPREVKVVGKMICSNCNTLIVFEPIENVRLIPTYKTKNQVSVKNPPKSHILTLTKIQEDAIMGLTGLGFSKKEATNFVSKHNFQSIEDYIQGAFRKN